MVGFERCVLPNLSYVSIPNLSDKNPPKVAQKVADCKVNILRNCDTVGIINLMDSLPGMGTIVRGGRASVDEEAQNVYENVYGLSYLEPQSQDFSCHAPGRSTRVKTNVENRTRISEIPSTIPRSASDNVGSSSRGSPNEFSNTPRIRVAQLPQQGSSTFADELSSLPNRLSSQSEPVILRCNPNVEDTTKITLYERTSTLEISCPSNVAVQAPFPSFPAEHTNNVLGSFESSSNASHRYRKHRQQSMVAAAAGNSFRSSSSDSAKILRDLIRNQECLVKENEQLKRMLSTESLARENAELRRKLKLLVDTMNDEAMLHQVLQCAKLQRNMHSKINGL